MKNILLAIIAIGCISLAGKCAKKKFTQGHNFTTVIGQTSKCMDCEQEVKFKFAGIKEDSRCPKNVNCAWEGQAVAEFVLQGDEPRTFELTLRAGHENLSTTTIDGLTYKILNVTPLPEQDKKIEPEQYTVQMVVGKSSGS